MKIKNLRNSNEGVVGIIVAVLLIGLMLAVISLIQTVFVPNWMEQMEADHMDQVSDQFAQLKFAIDIQSVLNTTDIPTSVPITLGSNNLPLLSSAQAYGSLEIMNNEIEIEITNDTQVFAPYTLGIIKYSSTNHYFINQDFNYESGSIIIDQYDGEVMSVQPKFEIEYVNSQISDINFNLVDINGIGNKLFASGYGNFPIRVEFVSATDSSELPPINNISYINITSTNYNSWFKFINNSLLNSLIDSSYYDIQSDPDNQKVILQIFSNDYTVNLNLKRIVIDAQIAPGWVDVS